MLLTSLPAAAQDQALDPLLFVQSADSGGSQTVVGAQTLELYRLPIGYTLRKMDDQQWGVSLTCPISISGLRVERKTNAGSFVHSLAVVGIVPGVEFGIPVPDRIRLHPFAEAGIGKGTSGGPAPILYGFGMSARADRDAGSVHVILGGNAMRRKLDTDTGDYETHSTFEAAVDAEVPLGFQIAQRDAHGGLYVIARGFQGLSLTRPGFAPVDLDGQFEGGLSFSTAPELRIWKITLPWVAVGYIFGPVLTGVRIYTSFPF
jgi:hypothetical protein